MNSPYMSGLGAVTPPTNLQTNLSHLGPFGWMAAIGGIVALMNGHEVLGLVLLGGVGYYAVTGNDPTHL